MSRKNLTRLIQRRRNAVEAIPPTPQSLAQLAFPRRYTVYCPAPGQGKPVNLIIYLLIYRYRTTV